MKVLHVDQITGIDWKYSFSLVNHLFSQGIDIKEITSFSQFDEK